jgi:choline dehydrogenase-like flavoprotein
VEYVDGDGVLQQAKLRAGGEVVLTAGAINSPKVLMLSGLGDPAKLAKAGIKTRVALPGVGANLMDHPGIGVTFELKPDVLRPLSSSFYLEELNAYRGRGFANLCPTDKLGVVKHAVTFFLQTGWSRGRPLTGPRPSPRDRDRDRRTSSNSRGQGCARGRSSSR